MSLTATLLPNLQCNSFFLMLQKPGLLCLKLLRRGVPAAEVKLLHACLSSSTGVLKFNGVCSDTFQLLGGVRQGSLLGGLLWSIYIDDLLLELEHSNYGCFRTAKWCGAFLYADDICFFSPTSADLVKLISITDSYCARH